MPCNKLFVMLIVFVLGFQTFCLRAGNGHGGRNKNEQITNDAGAFISSMFSYLEKQRETGTNKGLYKKIKLVDTENDLTDNDLKQLVSNNNKNLLNIFEKYLIGGCILKKCITESCDQICLTIINKRKETMYVSLRFQFGFGNSYDGIFYSIELLIKEIIVKKDTHKPDINLILKVNLI